MNMKLFISVVFVAVLSGCNTAFILPTETADISRDVEISSTKLEFKLVKKNSSVKKQSGITIALEPVNTAPEIFYRVSLKEKFQLLLINGKQSYEVTHTPFYREQANRVAFRLKISNNSNRVVRSKGAIVSVDVDGNTETIPSSAYKELTGLILVPNSTKEVIIYGPEISAIKGDGGVMRVGMYEIGVGDQYANFEWYLNYSSGQVSAVAPLKIETKSLLPTVARGKHGKVYSAATL